VRPVRYVDDTRSLVRVIGEVAFHTIAVAATGYWESPFIFALITAVMVAGFARGFAFALRVSIAACLAIGIPFLIQDGTTVEDVRTTAQWTVELVLVALIAGYARRVTGEADRAHSLALDRLGRLADANTLLYSLHRVAQSLPASLDLEEVLDTTMGRLRDLFTFDGATVLLLDETDESWVVMRWDGPRPAPSYQTHELPGPLREALAVRHPVMVSELLHEGGGMSAEMVSGLYAALPAREATVLGLVALEHRDTQPLRSCGTMELHARLRGAGGAGGRQRPLVRPAAHGGGRRGAHPHRPRPPRPHRPVAGLPGLRAGPHRQDRRPGRRRSPSSSAELRTDVRVASSARCATPSTTCAPT
jgi:uncharacterized protein YigA (DUF484 family)